MTIRPLEDKSELDNLLHQVPLRPVLQSWAWGEFQEKYGRRIWRLGAYDNQQLVGALTLIEHQLMLGKTYLYAPHGPVALNPAAAAALAQAAREQGKKIRAIYVKLDLPISDFSTGLFPTFQIGSALQPRHTLILNITPDEETLLAGMHQKTRYNIRLAQKHNVTVRWSTTDDDFTNYLKMQHLTAERQGIRLHPDSYFRLMYEIFRQAGIAELGVAEISGQPLAINLVFWHHDLAIYPHGGSSDEHREAMAPYLLQWETIRRAKSKGMTKYDFRGIAPEGQPEHKLAGVTRFKLGFGGARVIFPEAQDAVLDKVWWVAYRLAKRLRGGVAGREIN